MKTDCNELQLEFQGLGRQKIQVSKGHQESSSDGGLIALHAMEKKYAIIRRLARCFQDNRRPNQIKHEVFTLLLQRIFGLCQGYEDLNDHEDLRNDVLLRHLCGKNGGDILGGKSTLNRLELGKEIDEEIPHRYNRITWDDDAIQDLMLEIFLDNYQNDKEPIILDFDATDDPLHGDQEGRFFNGYYDNYCYLPLYVFCGSWILAAKLRTSDRDAADGSLEVLQRIVQAIRQRHPHKPIIFRGDSGFCRTYLLDWCEDNNVGYVVGMARNKRIVRAIGGELHEAKNRFEEIGKSQRIFTHIAYKTKTSWRQARRVVCKAEYLRKGQNPRFVVTNLCDKEWPPKELYEDLYCARGDMENRIKEQQLYLFADRTSTAWMSSNQLRLWFSSFAYLFFVILREKLLGETDWKTKQASTLRLKLLKVSALVKITCRAIKVQFPISYPYWDAWIHLSQAS